MNHSETTGINMAIRVRNTRKSVFVGAGEFLFWSWFLLPSGMVESKSAMPGPCLICVNGGLRRGPPGKIYNTPRNSDLPANFTRPKLLGFSIF